MKPRLRLPLLRGPLAALLLGLALALRALAPGGIMPAQGPDGIRLVLCGGAGQSASRTVPILPARAPAHDCSWCDSASPLLAGAPPPIAETPPAAGLPPRALALVSARRAALRAVPPARAPPLMV